jgi:hypothetical protein
VHLEIFVARSFSKRCVNEESTEDRLLKLRATKGSGLNDYQRLEVVLRYFLWKEIRITELTARSCT